MVPSPVDELVAALAEAIGDAEPAIDLVRLANAQRRFGAGSRWAVRQYELGNLTEGELAVQIQTRYIQAARVAFLTGKRASGPKGLTGPDRAFVDTTLAEDLTRMRLAPASGWAKRLPLYTARLRGLAELGKQFGALEDEPETLAWWVVGDAEHCKDCLALADGGPYRLDDLVGEGVYPASGHTQCGSNCACSIDFTTPLSEPQLLDMTNLHGYRVRRS